jgi:hypothetical protein
MASKKAPDAFTLQVHINAITNLLVFDRVAYENIMTHESTNTTKYYSADTKSKNRHFNIGQKRHQGHFLASAIYAELPLRKTRKCSINISNGNSDCCPTNEAMSTELCSGPLRLANGY